LENLKGRDNMEELGIDEKIILEFNLEIGWESVD